jgi:hypothetical protein
MPFFKFKGKQKGLVPKKASSMNNIYNDYGGTPKTSLKDMGKPKALSWEEDTNCPEGGWRGESLYIF